MGNPCLCCCSSARLHSCCCSVWRSLAAEYVGAWEDVKAEEQRRVALEAEMFKHKTRSTTIASEEQVCVLGLGWARITMGGRRGILC